jgi:ParB-like nuclease family protein
MTAQDNLSPKQFMMPMSELHNVQAQDYGVPADDVRIPQMVRAADEEYSGNPQKLSKLAEDIRSNGIREPLTILAPRPKKDYPNETARLVEGHHRLAAAHELGMKEVPVKIHKPSPGRYPGTYTYPTWGS